MVPYDYHVVSRWTLASTLEEITDVFRDTESLPRWWPAAFLTVDIVRRGGPDRLGQIARLHTKGWLPYTLRFHSTVTAIYPCGFTVVVKGDFEGWCVAHLRDCGSSVDLVFDWRVRVTKPTVRFLSPLFKRVFIANHLWVMARGQESLALELERRRVWRTRSDDRHVPLPPGPTFPYARRSIDSPIQFSISDIFSSIRRWRARPNHATR